ncbi:hypothetical protein LBMAG15_08860 [Actinomycetes bacterium]|nr:hypothetical protein LBMAG15_08860 [Actinomycetes bacterium]
MTTPGDQPDEAATQEVVLVVNPVIGPTVQPSNPLGGLVGAATGLVGAVHSVIEQTVIAGVNAALDRVVPIAVNAVLDRMDLTQIVLDHVDIDALVAKANMDAIIDKVPIVDIADYVIAEIDLPKIIRESTGGVATDAVNAARLQALSVDKLINRIADSMLLRSKGRKVESPLKFDLADQQ